MTHAGNRLALVAAATAATAVGLTFAAAQADAQPSQAVGRCRNGSLSVTRTFVQGAAGHSGMSLVYRNATTRACSITGFPGLDAVTRSGRVLAHAERVHAHHAHTVVVRPGRYASAAVEWRDFTGRTGRSCRTSAEIETIVANTTRVHRLPVAVGVCSLQVSPTVHRVPGYPRYAPAQHDWITASQVDAAGMNMYFRDAAGELASARVYPTQVGQLEQLASFPLTGLTHKQAERARADVAALNLFFATPRQFG